MTLNLDGFTVLERIGAKRDLFADIKLDVLKAAHALVGKRLKSKNLTLKDFYELREAIGETSFAHVIDGMPLKTLTSLVKKLEGRACENPLKRLHDLANGVAEPIEPAPKKRRAPAKKKTFLPGEVEFSSMYVVSKRRREKEKAGA